MTSYKNQENYVPLPEFTSRYFEKARMKIAPQQLYMASWLEESHGETTRLLLACRGMSKSTMSSLYCSWIMEMDPQLSMLVVSANQTVANNTLNQTKDILENHPYCTELQKKLKGNHKTAWNRKELRIPGVLLRDPNLNIKTLDSGITGTHCKLVISDDAETEESAATEAKRKFLKESFIPQMMSVGDYWLYIGTPWGGLDSIYKQIEDQLEPHCILRMPFKNEYIKISPQLFDEEKVRDAKLNYPGNKWRSQYGLEYILPEASGDLDPDYLLEYTGDIVENVLQMESGRKVVLQDVAAYYDVARGGENRDYSALSVVYTDRDNNYYIHQLVDLPEARSDTLGYKRQYAKIINTLKKLEINRVIVEEAGASLNATEFTNYAANVGEPIRAVSVTRRRNKNKFIKDLIEPALHGNKLYVNSEIDKKVLGEFKKELYEFPQSRHDDFVDATAGCLFSLKKPNKSLGISMGYRNSIRHTGRVVGRLKMKC